MNTGTYLYIDANLVYLMIAAIALLFCLVLYLAFGKPVGLTYDEADEIIRDAEDEEPFITGESEVPHALQFRDQRDHWKDKFVSYVQSRVQR